MAFVNERAIGRVMLLLLFLLSVMTGIHRLAFLRRPVQASGTLIAPDVDVAKYDGLSERVHSLYAEELVQSINRSYSNESLGACDSRPLLDLRNQTLAAPRAYNVDMVQSPSPGCDCVADANGRGPCCVRYYRRPHKMGNVLSLQLLPEGVRDRIRVTSSEFLTHRQHYDYRDVVLARDLFDAIVSGYLYHLSGRECWLDMYGRPSNSTFRWIDNFWRKLNFEQAPPRRDRSICQYLAEESTFVGMTMYTRMAMTWFKGLIASHRYSFTKEDASRTLFVCFAELERSQGKILDHFFPGGHDFEPVTKNADTEAYGGGHATSRNQTIRKELKDLLMEVDERLYSGVIGKMNEELGCVDK